MKNKLLLIFLLVLSLFIIIGCTPKKEDNKEVKKEKKQNIETEKDIYIKYVKKLKKVRESSEDLPFAVDIVYEKIKEEVRYQVVIDSPTTDIKEIKALAIHDKQTDDIFPSVGIFDDKIDLIIDKKPSGVILVGYIPYDGDLDDLEVEMKVLISYKINDETHTSYYVTKK